MTNELHPSEDAGRARAALSELMYGFWKSAVLFTANDVGVFPALADGHHTAEEVTELLGTDPRATAMLLDAAVALGLLTKRAHRYGLTPLSAETLVPGRPGYMGNIVRHSQGMWLAWGDLPHVLRAGKPRREGPRAEPSPDADRTRHFIEGMHDNATPIAETLMDRIDVSRVSRFLDIGGGPGTYCYAALHRNPSLSATILDLPDTLAIAREFIAARGLGDRVDIVAGDYNADPLPSGYDLALMSQVLHSNSREECAALIRKAFDALAPGGRLVIHEFALEEDRTAPLHAALFSLNMLANTDHGSAWTDREIIGWMKGAGFTGVIQMDLLGRTAAFVGRKP